MKRRELLKSLSLGALAFPLSNWKATDLGASNYLEPTTKALLELVSSTFIPEGKQKGAKGVGVVLYLERYIQDCLSPEDQQKVHAGLDHLKTLQFMQKNQSEREQVLLGLKQAKNHEWFYDFVRNQTILAYTNSEYVQTNFYGYVMAPGFYKGCEKI
jgi:hypothetical protein